MKILLIPLAGLLAVACSGSNNSSATAGASGASASSNSTTTAATAAGTGTGFASISGIFTANCSGCHIGGKRFRGGLDLGSYATLMKGGDDGAVVTAGDPASSILIKVLNGPVDNPRIPKMPPGKTLNPADVQRISDWIKAGAKES